MIFSWVVKVCSGVIDCLGNRGVETGGDYVAVSREVMRSLLNSVEQCSMEAVSSWDYTRH